LLFAGLANLHLDHGAKSGVDFLEPCECVLDVLKGPSALAPESRSSHLDQFQVKFVDRAVGYDRLKLHRLPGLLHGMRSSAVCRNQMEKEIRRYSNVGL